VTCSAANVLSPPAGCTYSRQRRAGGKKKRCGYFLLSVYKLMGPSWDFDVPAILEMVVIASKFISHYNGILADIALRCKYSCMSDRF